MVENLLKGKKKSIDKLAVNQRGTLTYMEELCLDKAKPMKTAAEWIVSYDEKAAELIAAGFAEVDAFEFYRDLFPEGTLQRKGEKYTGKGNIIATSIKKKGRCEQFIVCDDLSNLKSVVGAEFGLIAPVSFFGRTHTSKNAHELFALAIDIDYVERIQLLNLLKQFRLNKRLAPTYLVSSGRGLHLYYFLDKPISLYHNVVPLISRLKHDLIRWMWNKTSSLYPEKPDIAGVYQGFRCVGSQSKLGSAYPVKAYRISGKRYTLHDIKESILNCKLDLSSIEEKPTVSYKSHVSLAQAKKLYPVWYDRRIVQGLKKSTDGRTWTCNPALYNWWKNKISTEVLSGGRYFSIMALCAFGVKCGISRNQIENDARYFLAHLESLTVDATNHFTKEDLEKALSTLDTLDLKKFTRSWVEEKTKVLIPPCKRNYRTRREHLHAELWETKDGRPTTNVCKSNRELTLRYLKENKLLTGRPKDSGTKQEIVEEWRKLNPAGSKAECIRATGLSKPTVYKWWDAAACTPL